MRVQAVQHGRESAAQLTVEQRQESPDLFPAHIALVDEKMQPHPLVYRRHGARPSKRQRVAAIPTLLDRRLTAQCPGPAHQRLDHKATFVDQHGARALLAGFMIHGYSSSRHLAEGFFVLLSRSPLRLLTALPHAPQDVLDAPNGTSGRGPPRLPW